MPLQEIMMIRSDNIGQLAKALALAQSQFPPIAKTRTVKVATKTGGAYTFDYAEFDEIIGKTRPALVANGLAITQILDESSITTMLMHESGEWVAGVLKIPDNLTSQEMGAAVTYRARYAWARMCGVAAEEDDDGGLTEKMDHKQSMNRAYGATQRSPAASTRAVATNTPTTGSSLASAPPAKPGDTKNGAGATASEPPTDIDPETGEVLPDQNRDMDIAIALMEQPSLASLTTYFNSLAPDLRRPGSEAHGAFLRRRETLTKRQNPTRPDESAQHP